MKAVLGIVMAALFLVGLQTPVGAYDYPFSDPYVATVVGTPKKLQADLPERIPVQEGELRIFADREMPEVLWYGGKLRYSLVARKGPAPLLFAIAGTGASHDSVKMQLLQKAFYQAGFHVISLSSPTHPNFVTAASETSVPGRISDDVRDLYRVMGRIWDEVGERLEVTDFFLTGYSLGATQAAFLARLDERKRRFDFRKVLMINPPVSPYHSVVILDDMLENNVPGGMDHYTEYFQGLVAKFTEVYREADDIEFNDEFLYRVYRHVVDRGEIPTEENLAALIGTTFRIASANMVFTSDVMTNYGYIKPKNLQLTSSTPLGDYLKVSGHLGFGDYIDEYALPYFQAREPNLTREALIRSISLKSIEAYLREADKIALMHNADDLTLAPGELEYLRGLFGERAKIYPAGGHCGNMDYRENVAYMVDYFRP